MEGHYELVTNLEYVLKATTYIVFVKIMFVFIFEKKQQIVRKKSYFEVTVKWHYVNKHITVTSGRVFDFYLFIFFLMKAIWSYLWTRSVQVNALIFFWYMIQI